MGRWLASWVSYASPSVLYIYNQLWDTYRSLKTGGVEVAREKWDENDPNRNIEDSMDVSSDDKGFAPNFRNLLPDWTKTPLHQGAPSVNIHAVTPASVGT